ncbi:MAG: bifunctional hydroxymethylpyrimidine kinase/phosphomethylpyrimidine kinase [Spirochaetales bacterium]|nr:bifunctional hydroxymethylpyrimidine kinase/phosphomethylpyrimidine kinase [Spirochaetales bacterium]
MDPVMGDNGNLYRTYNAIMQEKMRDLVARADIITPNLTEAMFLLKRPASHAVGSS